MNTIKPLIIILLAALVASCNHTSGTEKPTDDSTDHESHTDTVTLTTQQINTVGIKLGQIESRYMSALVSTTGQLQLAPTDRADITSLMAGRVCQIAVAEGQQVRRGQVVAYIENTDIVALEQSYLEAYQQQQLAQSELVRQRALAQQGAGVERTLQQAQSKAATAQSLRQALAARLQQIGVSTADVERGHLVTKIPLRTPIQGLVSSINVSLGSPVDPSSPLMQISKNSAVYCQLNVFEADIDHVEPGQAVTLRLSGRESQALKGRVSRINPTINPQTRAFSVMVDIEPGQHLNLAPAAYVSASIHTSQREVPSLPQEAIVNSGGKDYIFVAIDSNSEKNNTKSSSHNEATHMFLKRQVVCGTTTNGYTQVSLMGDTLAKNARVVTAGAFYLASMTSEHGEH